MAVKLNLVSKAITNRARFARFAGWAVRKLRLCGILLLRNLRTAPALNVTIENLLEQVKNWNSKIAIRSPSSPAGWVWLQAIGNYDYYRYLDDFNRISKQDRYDVELSWAGYQTSVNPILSATYIHIVDNLKLWITKWQ